MTAGRILRGKNVKLAGSIRLDVNQTMPCAAGDKHRIVASPQVRIVENHPEYAIIELTCGCGAKTSVRCDYGTK